MPSTDPALRRVGMWAFGASGAALLVFLLSLPATSFFSADSGPKYWQCLAFAQGHGSPRAFDYPAASLDPERRYIPPFTAPVGDRLASIYPVLFPLVAAVPQSVAGDRAMRLLPWCAALLAAWLVGRLAGALRGERTSWTAAALALAATPLAFYAVAFWEHSLASAMVLAGMVLVVDERGTLAAHGRRWTGLGLSVGAGAWVRTEVVFLAPLLVVAALILPREGRARCGGACLAGCAAGLAAGAVVQRVALGTWLPLHVAYHLESSFATQPYLASRWSALVGFIAPDWISGGAVVVWLAALAVVVAGAGRRSRAGLVLALASVGAALTATVPMPALRWLQGARPTEAFPVSAPASTWIVLSALPLLLWGQRREELASRGRVLLAAAATWSIVAVFAARQVRSLEWGSRLFLTSVLLLVAVAASFTVVDGRWWRMRRAVVGATVAVAVVVQILGLVLLRHGVAAHERLRAEVTAFTDPGEPVVTDAYMVPLLSARGWWSRRYLYATGDEGVASLAAACAREGVERWTHASLAHGSSTGGLAGDSVRFGSDGSRWYVTDRLERPIGSEILSLLRYRLEREDARRSGWRDERRSGESTVLP